MRTPKPRGPAIVLTDAQAEVYEEDLIKAQATRTPGMVALLTTEPVETDEEPEPNG